MEIAPNDPRLCWEGAISLQHTEQWTMPWRLPYPDLDLFPPLGLHEFAAMSSGVRIVFLSNTTMLGGRIVPRVARLEKKNITLPYGLDLCIDRCLIQSIDITGKDQFRFVGLPTGQKLIELWLPPSERFQLRCLQLDDEAMIQPYVDKRLRWVVYGSSITHARRSATPTRTWPAIVARQQDLNLLCLGYGGNCHLEPMMACMMRDMSADCISICAGINIFNSASLNLRTLQPAVIGFIRIIREKQHTIPLVVMSPIYAPAFEDKKNQVGLTLSVIRSEIAAAVQVLKSYGDHHIYYIDGMEIMGPQQANVVPDGIHPNAQGNEIMARVYLEKVIARFFPHATEAE